MVGLVFRFCSVSESDVVFVIHSERVNVEILSKTALGPSSGSLNFGEWQLLDQTLRAGASLRSDSCCPRSEMADSIWCHRVAHGTDPMPGPQLVCSIIDQV